MLLHGVLDVLPKTYHGPDARGTKSALHAKILKIRNTARPSRNQSAMAILAMLRHGQDARGTKSALHAKILKISNTE